MSANTGTAKACFDCDLVRWQKGEGTEVESAEHCETVSREPGIEEQRYETD